MKIAAVCLALSVWAGCAARQGADPGAPTTAFLLAQAACLAVPADDWPVLRAGLDIVEAVTAEPEQLRRVMESAPPVVTPIGRLVRLVWIVTQLALAGVPTEAEWWSAYPDVLQDIIRGCRAGVG